MLSPRARLVVLEGLTPIATDDVVYQHDNPLGLAALRRDSWVDGQGSSEGVDQQGERVLAQADEDDNGSEYMTEEENQIEVIGAHKLFTPKSGKLLVNEDESSEGFFSTPSLDSMGRAIQEMDMEGWDSSNTEGSEQQQSPPPPRIAQVRLHPLLQIQFHKFHLILLILLILLQKSRM